MSILNEIKNEIKAKSREEIVNDLLSGIREAVPICAKGKDMRVPENIKK